ncbi:MAG: hypothetical protein H7833_18530 [Magnetococcus sp. DMHC-1]
MLSAENNLDSFAGERSLPFEGSVLSVPNQAFPDQVAELTIHSTLYISPHDIKKRPACPPVHIVQCFVTGNQTPREHNQNADWNPEQNDQDSLYDINR